MTHELRHGKRYPFAALAVLVSTVPAPILDVHRSRAIFLTYENELYFPWATYGLPSHREEIYWLGATCLSLSTSFLGIFARHICEVYFT